MKKILCGVLALIILVGTMGPLKEEDEFKNKGGPVEEANIQVIEYCI